MPAEALSLDACRRKAVESARRAAAELEKRGVKVVISGSLARGSFSPGSDVDFVVLECPRRLKYAIEGIVEDELEGIPFDVVYQEEIPPASVRRFMDGAVRAPELK